MQFIETVIGLAFIYFLGSIFTSAMSEAIAFLLNSRGETLKKAIESLLTSELGTKFYDHILIKKLHGYKLFSKTQKRPPSYFTAAHFSTVVVDMLLKPNIKKHNEFFSDIFSKLEKADKTKWKTEIQDFLKGLASKEDAPTNLNLVYELLINVLESCKNAEEFKTKLLAIQDNILTIEGSTQLVDSIKNIDFQQLKAKISVIPENDFREFCNKIALLSNDIKEFEEQLQTYFNDYMDRVSGWYKRKMQVTISVISFFFCLFFNIDTIEMSQTLWNNDDIRINIANAATSYYQNNPQKMVQPTTNNAEFKNIVDGINQGINQANELPFGWTQKKVKQSTQNGWLILEKILGFFLSCLAISLGAPFWFDLLGKFINLRVTGKKE